MLSAHTEVIDMYWEGSLVKNEDPVPDRFLNAIENENWTAWQRHIIGELSAAIGESVRRQYREDDNDESVDKDHNLIAILGPAGSGKSVLTQAVVRPTMELGGRVLITAPTGMLTTVLREKFPDVDVDTVHAAFLFHLRPHESLMVMQEYNYVIVEEVGQLTQNMFDRIVNIWEAADQQPVLVFVGDFYQLRDVPENDEYPARAFDSPKWPNVRKKVLTEMLRCKCDVLAKKLSILRTSKPTKKQFREIVRGHKAPERGNRQTYKMQAPTVEEILTIFDETPQTLFVTISKKATKQLNDLALDAKFSNVEPLCWVPGDPDGNPDNFRGQEILSWTPPEIPIFNGMTLILTQNLHKDRDYVNGMRVHVCGVTQHGVRVRTITGRDLVLYRWTDTYRVTYFPIRLGYATTLHKVQGLTLQHITLWLDVPGVEAAGYVALSRVQHDVDWRYIGELTPFHFVPMSGVP